MIAYGKNVMEQLRERPEQIEEVYFQEGSRDQQLLDLVRSRNIPYHFVSKKRLDLLSGQGVHQGVAAKIKPIKTYSLNDLIKNAKSPGFFIILDHIQDPHNLGAILRTADAAGVDGVILSKHESAGLNATAIKTSVGAAFSVPICVVANLAQAIEKLKRAGYWIVGTDFENARDYREGLFSQPVALVIGNEGKGMSARVRSLCDYSVYLPMKGKVSSLNASVAAAVMMYEVNRQREA